MGKLEPHLWDVVIPPLPLLLLQFDGDAADRAPLDSLHQVGDIPAGTRGCPGLSQGSWPFPTPQIPELQQDENSCHHLPRQRPSTQLGIIPSPPEGSVSDSNRVWGRHRHPQTRENSRSPLPALSMTRPQAGP